MDIELADCENTLIAEIQDKKTTKKNLAKTYRLAIDSSEKIDWRTVNEAIIERWSPRALEDIKQLAWSGKCFEED